MEQLLASQRLREMVDMFGFVLTLRIMANIAKDYAGGKLASDADYSRACQEIYDAIKLCADTIAGQKPE